jgi:hypothetical protein
MVLRLKSDRGGARVDGAGTGAFIPNAASRASGVRLHPRPADQEYEIDRGPLGSIGLETRQEAAFQPVEDPDSPDRDEWFVYSLSTVLLLVPF